MKEIRQSAWTKEEDLILSKTVLSYIREGKTQLDAFAKVASQLSRTEAACGFRWNASLRKQYMKEIEAAKSRRGSERSKDLAGESSASYMLGKVHDQLYRAVSLLESLKLSHSPKEEDLPRKMIEELRAENEYLRRQLSRYQTTWQEIRQIGLQMEEEKNN